MAADPTPQAASKSTVFLRRSASTLTLWVIVTAIFLSRWGWAYLGLIGALAILASVEYYRMLRTAGIACFPRFGMLACVLYCVVMYGGLLLGRPYPASFDAAAVFLVTAGAFTLQLRHPVRGADSLLAVASTVLGFVYIPYLFGFLGRIVFDQPAGVDGRVSEQGAYLLLWVLAVTKFTDMGAYLTGSLVGRHKMIPHVSPGKTWEGFAGALVFSQLAACGLFACFPGPLAVFGGYGHVVALGLLVALLAVVGDLAESVVKRSLEAKDSGRMLPGIGGSLDLIDSVCFTAPAVWLYLEWILSRPA